MAAYKCRSHTWVHGEHVPPATWLLRTHEYGVRRGHFGKGGGLEFPGTGERGEFFLRRESLNSIRRTVSSLPRLPPWTQGEFYIALTQLYLGLEGSQLSIVQVHILADDGNSHILYEAILRSSPQCGTLAKILHSRTNMLSREAKIFKNKQTNQPARKWIFVLSVYHREDVCWKVWE